MSEFWKSKSLIAMSRAEWESLCDGCAKCCLIKLEDDAPAPGEPPETAYTNIACKLLDCESCRCTDYKNRARRVPDCILLTPKSLPDVVHWLPGTCAYRLLWEGKDLPWWHPLQSGETQLVHDAGVSLKGFMVPEIEVGQDDLEDFIIPSSRIDGEPEEDL